MSPDHHLLVSAPPILLPSQYIKGRSSRLIEAELRAFYARPNQAFTDGWTSAGHAAPRSLVQSSTRRVRTCSLLCPTVDAEDNQLKRMLIVTGMNVVGTRLLNA